MNWKQGLRLVAGILVIGVLLDRVSYLEAERLWFQEVGYFSVFLLRLKTQVLLWLTITGLTALYLWVHLAIARRYQYPIPPDEPGRKAAVSAVRGQWLQPELQKTTQGFVQRVGYRSWGTSVPSYQPPLPPETYPYALSLRSLLPLTLGLSLLIGLLIVYYGQLMMQGDQIEGYVNRLPILRVGVASLWQAINPGEGQFWPLSLMVGIAVALLAYPQALLPGLVIGFSLILGTLAAQQWSILLPSIQPTSFNAVDPLFGQDFSRYIFFLPVWEVIGLWWMGVTLCGFAVVTLTYLRSGNSLSQGRFPGFSPSQQRHLYGMGSSLMTAIALVYWLSRFELLYSSRGVTVGASYTDIHVQLPINTALSAFALAIAAYWWWRSIRRSATPDTSRWRGIELALFGILMLLGVALPQGIQSFVVQPNELAQEQPYIERTIAFTRQAFGLEAIDVQPFNPQGNLTEADLATNALTIRNIRLWDERPLLETNRQLQQIRLYYRFPGAHLDRYTLQTEPESVPSPAYASGTSDRMAVTERRQVLIAARELDYSAVPPQAQTWLNRHLVYTHGYGFTLSPVNTVGAGGLPEYFVKDISGENNRALSTSSEAIRASIPIGQPRIYYGEITDPYVLTNTGVRELDYPSGSENAYNVYDGRGGVQIGSLWRRWIFALYLRDWRLLFTQNLLPDTKILFRRTIEERVRAIAPFLRFDRDPYLVVADTPQSQGQNYLYWMIDAYTTSDRYPYSDPGSEGINYIRNSVKAVIDAYHGSVTFYVADPSDPIITTWSAILPAMFKPLAAMPSTLHTHIRYPVDFFHLQSARLMTYHMTDPQVFYNREDQWQIPNEVYGSETQSVEPYYVITSLPAVPFEEFLLLLPYTPQERTNLIAWLAARSDGENYGKLLLYVFPKERLIYGTEQIEARINQDPVISQQISLWNRQGSRAIQGNLLVIPIEQSLLYVEPLYLEADQNSLPTLVRVIVAYENRIVMTPTLDQSLAAIFNPEGTDTTPEDTNIIRSLEDTATGQ